MKRRSPLSICVQQTVPKSSTAQDLMRGKPSEIDFLNVHVGQRGTALDVPTPANRVLWTLVKLAEHRGGG